MNKLLVVDAYALIHRGYHAVQNRQNNALFGLVLMLLGAVEREQPAAIALAWEGKGKNFRHHLYPAYKAGRPTMPDDLAVQLKFIRELLEILNLPVYECPGFEADDVIASLSRQAVEQGWAVTILTGDRDMLQLVSDRVEVLLPGQSFSDTQRIGVAEFTGKYGFGPENFVTYKALKGDNGDNIKGLPGVGDVWAKRLTIQFGSVEALLADVEAIESPK